MKQLTKSEFNKDGTTYKSITSPATDNEMTQITDIVLKDDTLAYSTDGENFSKLKDEVIFIDDITIYPSPAGLPTNVEAGCVYPSLVNGEPPVSLYRFNGSTWVFLEQMQEDTLYYSKTQRLIYTFANNNFVPSSYTNTNQLTNGAAFVNATTMANEINSAVSAEATLRSSADTGLQNSITALENNKQDNLTAGDCIKIINNVISASGFIVLDGNNVTISTLSNGAYQINAPTGGCDLYYSTQNSIELEGDTTSYLLVTDTNKWVLVKDSSVFVGSSTFAKELQTKLTAGANITIANDTISSTAGVVDSALSTTSENAVQNKVVTNALNGKYEKPVGGIPATDLASAVQTSLGKADTALQSISSSDVTTALGFTPYNSTNPSGYTKVESSTTNGNIKIDGTETTVYTLPSNVATSSDITTVQNDINAVSGRVTTIEGKIPTQASSSNQLADKNFVNSSINAFAAYYITKNAAGDPFSTKAELNAATTFYSGGVVRVPTTNDYCIVLADESKQSETGVDPTTRYSYQGSQWEYQYTVNDTPLAAAQLAALNSGITSALVTQISTNQTDIAGKQDKIDSSHKLSADLVDDTSTTNKFVTSSDITNWNSKQSALNSTQLAAVNSGITSALVTQIGTNQSNISSLSANKQDALTAGASIDITNNTIGVIVDSALSSTSENPLQNKVVNTGLFNLRTLINGKQNTLTAGTGITIVNDVISSTGGVTVDDALSSTSENPVQNKVINSALGNKLNTSGGTMTGVIDYIPGLGPRLNTNTNGSYLIYGSPENIVVQKKDPNEVVTGYYKLMDGDGKLYSQNNEVYTKSMILDFIYPIGSYFITENASLSTVAQVQAHFGGTWVQVTGRFLYGSTTAGTEAGEETHTLTIDEMPSHTHNIKLETGSLTGSSGRVKWAGNGDYQLYANSIMPTGGGQAHNNMPPYRTVYMFRRTA